MLVLGWVQILLRSWGLLTVRACQPHFPCPDPVTGDTAELSPPLGHPWPWLCPRRLLAAPEWGWFPSCVVCAKAAALLWSRVELCTGVPEEQKIHLMVTLPEFKCSLRLRQEKP